jgi:hypothetical protein
MRKTAGTIRKTTRTRLVYRNGGISIFTVPDFKPLPTVPPQKPETAL